MIITCPACQARYKFDESRLGNRPRARTRCAKCGAAIDIENPLLAASVTLPPSPEAPPAPEPPPPPPPRPAAPAPAEKTEKRRVQGHVADDPTKTASGIDPAQGQGTALPRDRRYSLAVIQGAATGQIFQISRSRTLIGRTGADINLDDPEASRQHASLEITGDLAILRDLESTNGTWVDNDRIAQHELGNQMEFRIGSHVLMFIITGLD